MRYIKYFMTTIAIASAIAFANINTFASATSRELVGECKLTFYCPCRSCSEGWGNKTSTGTYAKQGRTIAVDPSIIPYGSTVYIEGWGYYTAEDCGGGIKGNHIDIYRDNHSACDRLGVKHAKVYIVD